MLEREDTTEQVIAAIKTRQEESNIPESELILCIWQGLMGSVDWSARPDQIEGLALREVTVSTSSPSAMKSSLTKYSEICTYSGAIL
jgi:hypothetical protein